MPIVGCSLFCLLWPPPLHVYVCDQPLTLHRHLQLAPAAEGMHTTSSSYLCCLSWSLAPGLGGTAKDPDSYCSHCGHPQCSPNYVAVGALEPRRLSRRFITVPWTQCCYAPPLTRGTLHTGPGITTCSSMSLPAGKSLPLPKLVHKVWNR